MFGCLDALRDLWHSGRFLQLRCGLCDRREELRATQAEAHRAACLLLRCAAAWFARLGGTPAS